MMRPWLLCDDSCRRDLVAELELIDDLHTAHHTAECGEVAFVVGLRCVAERVPGPAGVEARGRPAQIAARQSATGHLITQCGCVPDGLLLCDEVGNEARELRADDVT